MKAMFVIYAHRIKLGYYTDPERYNEAMKAYAECLEGYNCTLSVYYLLIMDLRKLLIELKIDTKRYESTQLFKQGAPFKTLHYGEITKEI